MAGSDHGTKALVVEDAREFAILITRALRDDGFEVEEVGDGLEAVDRARTFQPDVVLLDLGLPSLDGVEVCRQIRGFSDAYVIMLTARDDETDVLIGLAVGADDYLAKPFSERELVARVRAMLRRPRSVAGMAPASVRTFGDLMVDVDGRRVSVGGEAVELTKIEFDLLATLSARPNVVFSRALLLEAVWGPDWYGDDHIVDVHIAEMRKKLGDRASEPKYIRTVRGVGYRMISASAS